MYLLYLDESGNENDPNDRYFVLGGLALFERQTFFLTQEIEAIQEKHFPNHQPVPFHASEIRSGRNLWRRIDHAKREEVLADLSTVIMQSPARGRILYRGGDRENPRCLWRRSRRAGDGRGLQTV